MNSVQYLPVQLPNETSALEFTMLCFPALIGMPAFTFCILLLIYIFTVSENMLIIILTRVDSSLGSPMYFFLENLSFVDILLVSVTVPKTLGVVLAKKKVISFYGCMTQMYFFLAVGITESSLLTVMSYDRYIAICHPLRYNILMTSEKCSNMVLTCWLSGFVSVVFPVSIISRLTFCQFLINHFFCDVAPVIHLACSDTSQLEMLLSSIACFVILGTFPIILISYIFILFSILNIPSSSSKKKAFSTCGAHLTVVLIYFGTITFMYIRPKSKSHSDIDKKTSVFYSLLIPALNPLIYSLRNNDVKSALKKIIRFDICH